MTGDDDGFVRLARTGDIPEGEARPYVVGRRQVAIFRIDGEYHAIDNLCPHRGASLAHGFLRGHIVTCPLHRWEFDVRNGHMQMAPGVESFRLRVEGDWIFVAVKD